MFEVLNVWMFECLCPLIADLKLSLKNEMEKENTELKNTNLPNFVHCRIHFATSTKLCK
jgi:hypothetical protein